MRKSIGTKEQEVFQALLKQCRLDVGLTQVQLAELLKTPRSRISDYEKGARRMDLPQLKHYLDAMGVSVTTFVEAFVALCDHNAEG
jgi:transcriptional regulator with XRE-family HTH domain